MGIGVGWGIKGRNHCALSTPDERMVLVFFLHCIFLTVSLINEDERVVDFTPFLLPVPQGRKFYSTAFHCFSWPQSRSSLDNILSFKEEVSFGF